MTQCALTVPDNPYNDQVNFVFYDVFFAPAYLSKLVDHYKPGRILCSSSLDYHKFVELPTSLITGGERAFSKASPVLWNKCVELHV